MYRRSKPILFFYSCWKINEHSLFSLRIRPRQHVSVLFENGYFFLRLGLLELPRIGHYRDTPTGESSQEISTELTTCRELWKNAQLWVYALTSVSQFLVKSTLNQLTIRRAYKVNYYKDCRLFLYRKSHSFAALMQSFDFWYINKSCVKTVGAQFPWRILY